MDIQRYRPAALVAAVLGLCNTQAMAVSTNTSDSGGSGNAGSFISDGKVSGYIRAQEWTNRNFYNGTADTDTFAIGGKLKAESGSIDNFSVGAAFYTSHTPQSTRDSPLNYDPTLGTDIDTVGELYVNYRNDWLNIRGGRQSMETPFANSADYRMVPALYEGVTGEVKPTQNVSLSFGRIWGYKNWVGSGFDRTNNETDGPFAKSGLAGLTTDGFWYAGAHATTGIGSMQLTSQLWYYNFTDIAHLAFLDEKLALPASGRFKPFIGFQYANEKETGAAILGAVNSTPYGLKIGADFDASSIAAAVVHLPTHQGTFNNGGLASPYTDGYGSAALFTGNMLFPTEGLGSGNAYQLSGSHSFSDAWSAWAAYNRFNQTADGSPAEQIDEYVLSVTYTPHEFAKKLQVVDMLGYATLAGNSHDFMQNRLMLQYAF